MGLCWAKVNLQGCNMCEKFEQVYYTQLMYSNPSFVVFVVNYSMNKKEFKIVFNRFK